MICKTARPAYVVEYAMAVPPSYSDLGKSARDVFNKGYGFGMVKLELKTKSSTGVVKDQGLTFIQKWNTDNTLGTEVSVENQLAAGLKLAIDTTFVPNTGEFEAVGRKVAPLLGFDGWLAGYQMAFDTAKYKVTQNNFALGYKAGDFQLHTNVNDGTEFGGSIYQKVNDNIETSVNLAWTAGSNNTRFGIAAKYQMDEKTSVVAKVNNASLIGIGYTQTLRPGVKLTLSSLIDGKNFSAGGHKIDSDKSYVPEGTCSSSWPELPRRDTFTLSGLPKQQHILVATACSEKSSSGVSRTAYKAPRKEGWPIRFRNIPAHKVPQLAPSLSRQTAASQKLQESKKSDWLSQVHREREHKDRDKYSRETATVHGCSLPLLKPVQKQALRRSARQSVATVQKRPKLQSDRYTRKC
ncbi:hypothetical protein IHE44_0010406 [Lamprotornis superbus]|uniref:Non-selective voltage-gated ion channel VDAC3 n=1 Tax=Lamprotornis superbus TaxID=245042 RepID=A0A835TT88_9PASS|nr:hypothetical protein IHE44_0010406 [Lamprotornis superbus]